MPPRFALGEQIVSTAAREQAERADRNGAEKKEAKSPRHDAENAANFVKDPSMIGAIGRSERRVEENPPDGLDPFAPFWPHRRRGAPMQDKSFVSRAGEPMLSALGLARAVE